MRELPVVLRAGALADLTGIADYLIEQGASETTALGFVDRIEARCKRIGGVPEGGPARPDLGDGIRIAPFERSVVILYCVTAAAVKIVRVYYGGRNYEALLREKD